MKIKKIGVRFILILSVALFFCVNPIQSKELVLQEMSWIDVQEYLKSNDMVIIPLGSTEQHGPHMPLGTDYYEAFGMSKMISRKTGVIVAPVLFAGYSEYHSGFPGTLSLKPETMVQVLYETAELLIKYGFRKFMFFNYHGGNSIVQQSVIHRINHTTEAAAIAIGLGGSMQKSGGGEFFDWHAGKGETSIMLYLKPELVKMELAKKPEIKFTKKVEKLYQLAKKSPDLKNVASLYLGVPVETQKGGASHELSNNGIWSFSDVTSASKDMGKQKVSKMVDAAAKFIEAWKKAD
ncbi:hypothetical protein B6I21_09560 [candidate division KSB1 bacterium 4572_119]|nr:MAG: hypothetical protein B6I21_09560 [candidate division KSB1 bacterium 4572_119]